MVSVKEFKNFVQSVSKLEPIELIGLAKVMNINLLSDIEDDEGDLLPRDFVDIFSDMMDAYQGLGKNAKKNISIIINECTKKDKRK